MRNLRSEVEGVKNIMTQNVERILARGENLDHLRNKTEDLEATVRQWGAYWGPEEEGEGRFLGVWGLAVLVADVQEGSLPFHLHWELMGADSPLLILLYSTDWCWGPGNGFKDWGWGAWRGVEVGADPWRHFLRQMDGSVSLCLLRLLS